MKDVISRKKKDESMDRAVPNTLTQSIPAVDPRTEKLFLGAFDDLAPKLYRYCLLRVGSKPLAEDLVSDTFLKTWEYLGRGGEIRFYSVFLYKTLQNGMADHWRSAKHRREAPLGEDLIETLADTRDLPEEVGRDIEVAGVLKALKTLPQGERQVLYFRFVDGLSAQEIAELTGKKPNAVYVSIFRGVRRIRAALKNHV